MARRSAENYIEQQPHDSLSLDFVLEVPPECKKKQPLDTQLLLLSQSAFQPGNLLLSRDQHWTA